MKPLETILEPVDGYLFSITRNALKGWYELEIGIHKGWVFNENSEISCEVIEETDTGKLIKIAPKNENIVIDDLLDFVRIIIGTNEKITKKEQEFNERLLVMKGSLEEEARKFYEEVDELKNNSFNTNNEAFVKTLQSQSTEKKRGRPSKKEEPSTSVTETTQQ
jgi:hypothetical protein